MGSILLSLLASVCTAISSLCFRKNADNTEKGKSPSGYLVMYYLISFIFSQNRINIIPGSPKLKQNLSKAPTTNTQTTKHHETSTMAITNAITDLFSSVYELKAVQR